MIQDRPLRRRVAAASLTVSLLAGVAACSGDPGESAESPSALPSRSVGQGATLEAKPVPLRVSLVVLPKGKVPAARQERIKQQVGWVIGRYLDDAFLAGDYPRKDFGNPFRVFTPAAVARAAKQRALLTNAPEARVTESVVPLLKSAQVRTLVHKRLLPGATAFFRLVFRQEYTDGTARRVTVTGRLLLTGLTRGGWRIFGYDVKRWARPAPKGAGS